MARNNQRGSNNNNAEGRNQYTNGWRETARDRPMATAAAAAAAVGAGVFLWSRRNQISDQLSSLSDQFSQQFASTQGGDGNQMEFAESGSTSSTSGTSGSTSRGGGKRGKSGGQGFSATGSGGSVGATAGTGTTNGAAI